MRNNPVKGYTPGGGGGFSPSNTHLPIGRNAIVRTQCQRKAVRRAMCSATATASATWTSTASKRSPFTLTFTFTLTLSGGVIITFRREEVGPDGVVVWLGGWSVAGSVTSTATAAPSAIAAFIGRVAVSVIRRVGAATTWIARVVVRFQRVLSVVQRPPATVPSSMPSSTLSSNHQHHFNSLSTCIPFRFRLLFSLSFTRHVATLGQGGGAVAPDGCFAPSPKRPTCNFLLHINFPSPLSLDAQMQVIT